ncbi:COPB [Hepatospora eriocheir]|uniref:COPB n=1 Tax=Hepatospora eriocheir TaxID=1081669 RepID=A0A1X0QK73_9MICR|nr:COPB [Hepatospora eriocheir]
MLSALFVEDNEVAVDESLINKDPELACKSLISQQSKGNFNQDLLFPISNAIMTSKNNKVKRLFYYYMETIVNEEAFIMCISQVNKDLESPNEYVRGLALKLVSKFNLDHINLNIIKENLNHNCYYVRMNAVSCLITLALRFSFDIKNDLIRLLTSERNSKVINVIFAGMSQLNISIDQYLNENYSNEVLIMLVKLTENSQFISKLISSDNNELAFISNCKLIKIGFIDKANYQRILGILKFNTKFRKDFLPFIEYLNEELLINILELVDPFEYQFSTKIIDKCINEVSMKNHSLINDVLFRKYKDTSFTEGDRCVFKIMLLEKMCILTKMCYIYNDELLDEALTALKQSDQPEILFAYLKYVGEIQQVSNDDKITNSLIDLILIVKYGKILRTCLDVISYNIDVDNYTKIVDLFIDLLNDKSLANSFADKFETFIVSYICLSVCSMYKKEFDCKAKVIAMVLKSIQFGKESRIMDASSHLTLLTVLRSFINDSCDYKPTDLLIEKVNEKSVFDVINFKILNRNSISHVKNISESTDTVNISTVQLTSISDPLYVECNVSFSKYDCLLDYLIINQTSHTLQSLEFDYVYSPQLSLINGNFPLSIAPESAITVKNQFSVLESSSSFISGTISFTYRDNNILKQFYQHLSEIKLDIKNFLIPTTTDFIEKWKALAW